MIKHFEDGKLEKEELTAHVSTLVYAFLPFASMKAMLL
jgi:hypothetical protein